jgi:hypothetical protein
MRRRFGHVQMACRYIIKRYEERGELATTYNIAAYVYQVKPDKDGNRWITDAQHVAVKRALEGLQRWGRVIGFRTGRARDRFDGRTETCNHWMTEKGLAKWLDAERQCIQSAYRHGGNAEYFIARRDRILAKAKAIGMKIPDK